MYDLYDIFCGVLYVLKSGCQWRMLPSDFPKWQTCYKYYRSWKEVKEFERPDLPFNIDFMEEPAADISIIDRILKKINCEHT